MEVKWKDDVDALRLLNSLKEKAKSVCIPWQPKQEFYIFFAKSFRKDIIDEKNVILVPIESLSRLLYLLVGCRMGRLK